VASRRERAAASIRRALGGAEALVSEVEGAVTWSPRAPIGAVVASGRWARRPPLHQNAFDSRPCHPERGRRKGGSEGPPAVRDTRFVGRGSFASRHPPPSLRMTGRGRVRVERWAPRPPALATTAATWRSVCVITPSPAQRAVSSLGMTSGRVSPA
jgi:hypothetical protein